MVTWIKILNKNPENLPKLSRACGEPSIATPLVWPAGGVGEAPHLCCSRILLLHIWVVVEIMVPF